MPEDALGGAEAPPAGLEESLGWVGAKLDDVGGDAVGRVDGILVDARSGTPTWVVVRLGRFGARCAVPHDLVAGGSGRAWTSLSREAIRATADVDPAGGLDCDGERALAGRYGLAVRGPCSEESSDAAGSVPAAS